MYIDLGDNDKIEVEELWSISKCVICCKNLTLKQELCRSKLLPCLHAMCHKCFIKYSERGDLQCPSCSFSFNKEEIYDNKVLYEIVSDTDIPKTKNIVCSIHDTKVTHWCENCNEFICENCVKHHGQLKSTRTHTIISKEKYICKLLSGTPKTAFPCDVHPKNELAIICHSCQAMTCRDCQLEHHKDHKYDFIVDKADSAKHELYSAFKKIEFHSLIMTAALSKISERETKIEDLKKKIVADIKKEFDLIEDMLRKRASELMLSAIEKANIKLEECEKNRNLLQENLNVLQHCLTFVKCVLFTSSDSVLYYTKDLMLNRMKRLHFVNRVPCAVDVINLSFAPDHIDEIKKEIQNCGAIQDCQDPSSRDKNYWNSIYTALYKEYKEKSRSFEERKQKDISLSDLLNGTKLPPDSQKSVNPVAQEAEKPVKLAQSSLLRQDGSDKEKAPPFQDPRAATGSQTSQQPAVPNLPSNSILSINNEHQNNHGNVRVQTNPQLTWTNQSLPQSWHIPETVRLASRPVSGQSVEMGNGIKKVRLPVQNPPVIDLTDGQPFTDFEALDEILKDLGAMEEREFQGQETSREYQSPTGLPNDFLCSVCLGYEALISCNNCPKVFHRDCHIPAIPFPLPSRWTCILCQEISPLPPDNYSHFRQIDKNIANRLLLELFCQVEASAPFRRPILSSCSKSICLLDIKAKLAKGRYGSILDFLKDVKFMFGSCYQYRQGEADVITHAQSLEEIFNRLLSKFIPHL